MQRIIYLLLLLSPIAWSMEIDIAYLQKKITDDPKNVGDRLILSKYFLQNNNYNQSSIYLHEIYKTDPTNKKAKALEQDLQKLKELLYLFPNTELQNPFEIEKSLEKYRYNNQCKNFIKSYELLHTLHITVTDKTDLDAAICYLKENNLHKSKLLLNIKDFLPSDDLLALQALISLKENNLEKANAIYTKMQKEYPQTKSTKEVFQSIQEHIAQKTQKVAQTLSKENSISALRDYVYLLTKQNRQQKAISAVKLFVSENPDNLEAKILLVKLYYWNDNLDKAFHTMYPFRRTNFETKKLYANILYERGDYQHALYYLPEIANKTKASKERYNLQKRVAFAYAYMGIDKKADHFFQKLLKENPKDTEILEFRKAYTKQRLLQKAGTYQNQKKYNLALKLYKKYYQQTKDPKIAKEIAEICYFKEKYKAALPYFRAYLTAFPADNLIRFHYASALEKLKKYKKSSIHYAQIKDCNNKELCYLAQYHYAYNLMQTQTEQDWLEARHRLLILNQTLSKTSEDMYKDLKKYIKPLLKTVEAEIQKPTYYKDIVLTEGATKMIDVQSVFSNLHIVSTTKPSLKTLLHIDNKPQHHKPTFTFTLDYANDAEMIYRNYQLMVSDLLTVNGIRYSVSAKKYLFDFQHKQRQKGKSFFLTAKNKNLAFALGVEQFPTFNTLVPKITWSPLIGAHNLFIDFFYRNGAFENYRNCMIENQTNVFHVGIYDRVLMDNLSFTELGLTVNAYDDHNINIYAMAEYPLYTNNLWGMDHTFTINENIDYNSKTDVCYLPARLYDSTYLKYKPKITFQKGSVEIALGSGYSFKNKEQIYNYALKADYIFNHFVTFEINCEKVQSSFTTDDIDYCTLNIIQGW